MSPPPLVTVRPCPDHDDTGPRFVVTIAGMDGPAFATPALAALYADQLAAALSGALARSWLPAAMALDAAAGARAAALRADRGHLDALTRHAVGPTGAALAVLRWVCEGEEVLRPVERDGDGEMAVIHDGEESEQ